MSPIESRQVAVAVFAKAPIPGLAKTRMIPRLGAEGAADLQRRLLGWTLETAVAAELGPVSLWCAPSCDHPVFAAHRDGFGLRLFEQRGEDLGARMLHAFSALCAESPVLLVGTDCPALTAHTLRSAAQALLCGKDAVFLPAEDGGYVLIGLSKPEPALFENMPWGTDRVMAETRARLSGLGLNWTEPETLWDVDRPEDLDRLADSGLFDDGYDRRVT
ncbi:TIGR04282 family arsenosugar biosynthesis glycosyltransferase [Methylococcus sp. EFPC2]|uniref:TIGR04282 family arsenosugar biosynthesis glycosyltransferase n=1 Tax=Methylococcus sp. EFPC2 TaxID=2812648 RepID=UPI00196846B5|nr:TIGR04282 family arsenosugar biosynthesis glycosyltransferase [Methylococcus sp. EFPC2]QSA96328.1 TIGR04282 family arsenosugar biosynthesis glycosyltransferase [Methylococcus sp. EFPC2]